MSDWDLYILNYKFEKIGMIQDYESMIWTERYDECGDFKFVTKMTPELETALSNRYFLGFSESNKVMMLETSSVKSQDLATISGKSVEWAYNFKATPGINLEGGVNPLSATASNIMRAFVNSPIRYRYNEVQISTDAPDGPVIAPFFEAGPTYERLTKLAKMDNLGFQITLQNPGADDNQLLFQVYRGTDRSTPTKTMEAVIFSAADGQLTDVEHVKSSELMVTETLYLAGGSWRVVDNPNEAGTWLDILGTLRERELFLDWRQDYGYTPGPSDYNMADERARVEMKKNGSRISVVTGTPTSSDAPRLNEHYFLGDIVMLKDLDGNQSKTRVSEHIWSADATGKRKYPTFEAI